MPSMISEAAVRVGRFRDALAAGNVLRPDDAATLHSAWHISERRGIPIERALKLPARWRTQVRILDVLVSTPHDLFARNESLKTIPAGFWQTRLKSRGQDRGNHRGTKR